MQKGLARFADSVDMPFIHQNTLFTEKEIRGKIQPEAGDLFVILDDHLLLETSLACRERSLIVGKDVGLIVINDGPFYPYLSPPVSVISADFYRMGVAAADFVMHGSVSASPVSTALTVRKSL
jgi:DNA-binding LacI/PurR family transcriptional regulator